MRQMPSQSIVGVGFFYTCKAVFGAALFCLWMGGCGSVGEIVSGSPPEQVNSIPAVQTPANFEIALKDIQTAQAAGKIRPDMALFNTGVVLAHPSNPKKDYPKALVSFKTVVTDYPKSAWLEQSKSWIQVIEQQQKVIEQQQKVSDERQKITEEKRALARERELLSQERQKQNYTNERSRQLDLEIEKRRRQSLGK